MNNIESEEFIKGKGNFGLGKYEIALIHFLKALEEIKIYENLPPLEIYPSCFADIFYYIGKSYLHLKQYEDAAIAFYKKTERTPECYDSWDSLGLAYQNIGHFKKSEECYTAALELNPDFASALHNLGLLKCTQEKYNEAFPLLYKALSLDKKNPNILRSFANLMDKTGKSRESFQYYEDALKYTSDNNAELINSIKQDYAEALNQVGHELFKDNKFSEASIFYKKAYEQDPNNINTLNQLGMCASEQGDIGKALKYFNQMIKISGAKDADGWLNRAYCLQKQKKLLLAKGAINISLELNSEDETSKDIYQEILSRRALTKWRDFVKNKAQTGGVQK